MTISAEEIAEWKGQLPEPGTVYDKVVPLFFTYGDLRRLLTSLTDMKAEIERLTQECKAEAARGDVAEGYFNDATKGLHDRIAALEAQLAEAVAALKPFASVGRIIDGPFGPALFAKDDHAFKNGCAWRENGENKFLTWGDFRRAASICVRSEQESK